MSIILFDDISWESLLPLTFTRPVSELRVGILRISEKWKFFFNEINGNLSRDYLKCKYKYTPGNDNLLINSSVLPGSSVVQAIKELGMMQSLWKENKLIALRLTKTALEDFNFSDTQHYEKIWFKENINVIERPWHIFVNNGDEISNDLKLIAKNRKTEKAGHSNSIIKGENIFIEEGVRAEYTTLNASTGPIYLGRNSEIMEGAAIRGPFALCEGATVKMGAKIYGATTIGPYSTVGGEIKNSVIQAYSNKAHDGYLGNSVLGEWCNLGADSNNSNLKNNYAEVKLWSYLEEKFILTGLLYCGLIMGDHSKCGINTMFNTGTVVGVNVNLFGTGFPRNFIPSFSQGSPQQGFNTYPVKKAFEVADTVMKRRGLSFGETDQSILCSVYQLTEKYRTWHTANNPG